MIEYTEQAQMVDALRYCNVVENPCRLCPGLGAPLHCRNGGWIAGKAADMIEAQYQQIEELRKEIADMSGRIFDLNAEIERYEDEEVDREERCGL